MKFLAKGTKKLLTWSLAVLGLAGSSSSVVYYSLNSKFKKYSEWEEKILNSAKKIENKIKNHKYKKNFKAILEAFLNLKALMKFIGEGYIHKDLVNGKNLAKEETLAWEAKIAKGYELVKEENALEYQEIYEEIENFTSLIIEFYERIEKLREKRESLKLASRKLFKRIHLIKKHEENKLFSDLMSDLRNIHNKVLRTNFKKNKENFKSLEKDILDMQIKFQNHPKEENSEDLYKKIYALIELDFEILKSFKLEAVDKNHFKKCWYRIKNL